MIVPINVDTLSQIQNPVFRAYADLYVSIYTDFLAQISRLGLELEDETRDEAFQQRSIALQSQGAVVRNDGKSLYLNSISPSCEACRTSEGSATFFISLRCHRSCYYCFNPNQEDYEFYLTHKRNLLSELDEYAAKGKRLEHIALTGGEPLLHPEETLQFFRHARQLFPQAYTRLYTSGDQLTGNQLAALRDAGLDEIRLSIRMHDQHKAQAHTYQQLALAREFIPCVMVEMPVLPGTLQEMKTVLQQLDQIGIAGINLLEFCFPLVQSEEFQQRGFRIKAQPFRILYNYWYAGGLPIAGSEEVCLDLLAFALDQKLKLGVHYCSLENKHTGQIFQQNFGQKLAKTAVFSQKDFFIKTAKVFGEDIARVKPFLYKARRASFEVNPDHNYLQFNPIHIPLLRSLDIQVGISSAVMETREDGQYLRELAVDLTTPQNFDFARDI